MNKSTIQERRKSIRRNVSYYLPILNNDSQQVIGHLVDISPIGLMMDCKKNIPSGQDFHLRIDLTENMAGKAYVEFIARCKWCRSDKIQPYLFNAGFEIVRISPSDIEVIKNIASRYGGG